MIFDDFRLLARASARFYEGTVLPPEAGWSASLALRDRPVASGIGTSYFKYFAVGFDTYQKFII